MWRRLLPVVALTACSGTDVTPTEQATLLAARRVERADARADEAVRNVESVDVRVRHSPAPCDCPAWEAWMFGRWVRVELRADDEDAQPLPIDGEPVRVTLLPTAEVATADNGWNYPVFRVNPERYIREGRSIE